MGDIFAFKVSSCKKKFWQAGWGDLGEYIPLKSPSFAFLLQELFWNYLLLVIDWGKHSGKYNRKGTHPLCSNGQQPTHNCSAQFW